MKKVFKSIVILLLCSPMIAMARIDAPVVVPEDVYQDYLTFIEGRDPLTLTNFEHPASRRDVVEIVLLQQAIARSGLDFDVHFVMADSPQPVDMVVRGEAVATGTAAWRNELIDVWNDVFITTALVDRGEFVAGFYTVPDNQRALSASTRDDVLALVGASSSAWTIDWMTLENIPFEQPIVNAPDWPTMVNLVSTGQADFLLAPFQTGPGMALNLDDGLSLVPIPNFRIGLAGTRNLAVSRTHPNGPLFNAALHRGLLMLKKDGIVRDAYVGSGFFHPDVEDWTLIEAENFIMF